MEWSAVTATPTPKLLRQFAGLSLSFFVGWALWRAWHGQVGLGTGALGTTGLVLGALGLWRPATIRFVYTGWMIAAFPIGWTMSRLVVAALFYIVFTPVALIFRLLGRDALHVRRRPLRSYWTAKAGAGEPGEYFRQS